MPLFCATAVPTSSYSQFMIAWRWPSEHIHSMVTCRNRHSSRQLSVCSPPLFRTAWTASHTNSSVMLPGVIELTAQPPIMAAAQAESCHHSHKSQQDVLIFECCAGRLLATQYAAFESPLGASCSGYSQCLLTWCAEVCPIAMFSACGKVVYPASRMR